jgi:hypothetical protein
MTAGPYVSLAKKSDRSRKSPAQPPRLAVRCGASLVLQHLSKSGECSPASGNRHRACPTANPAAPIRSGVRATEGSSTLTTTAHSPQQLTVVWDLRLHTDPRRAIPPSPVQHRNYQHDLPLAVRARACPITRFAWTTASNQALSATARASVRKSSPDVTTRLMTPVGRSSEGKVFSRPIMTTTRCRCPQVVLQLRAAAFPIGRLVNSASGLCGRVHVQGCARQAMQTQDGTKCSNQRPRRNDRPYGPQA